MLPQPAKKQRIRHDLQQQEHENQYPNNISNGNQPSQVLNYQLVELIQTNYNLSIGISKQPEDSLIQVDIWTTYDHRQDIHVEPRASYLDQLGHNKLLHTLDKGMMPTPFQLQGQPWQFYNTVGNSHGEQTILNHVFSNYSTYPSVRECETDNNRISLNSLPIT